MRSVVMVIQVVVGRSATAESHYTSSNPGKTAVPWRRGHYSNRSLPCNRRVLTRVNSTLTVWMCDNWSQVVRSEIKPAVPLIGRTI